MVFGFIWRKKKKQNTNIVKSNQIHWMNSKQKQGNRKYAFAKPFLPKWLWKREMLVNKQWKTQDWSYGRSFPEISWDPDNNDMQGKGANKAFSEQHKWSKRNDDILKDTVTFVIYLRWSRLLIFICATCFCVFSIKLNLIVLYSDD